MALVELLAQLVAEAGDVQVKGSDYARNGHVFAAHPTTGVVELRLGPDLAEAARRTTGVGPSPRGDDWVRFAPQTWDDHARDRLDAWFRVAWHRATG